MTSGVRGAREPSPPVGLSEVVSHPTNAACVLQAVGPGAALPWFPTGPPLSHCILKLIWKQFPSVTLTQLKTLIRKSLIFAPAPLTSQVSPAPQGLGGMSELRMQNNEGFFSLYTSSALPHSPLSDVRKFTAVRM